jgi:methyl acetate hydrolase
MQNELNFAYEFFSADDLKYRGALNIPTVVSSTFASVRTVLQFDPGERWNYGCNIDWLGRIVEQQRGKRLGEVFKERIFGPLGITDLAFTCTTARKTASSRRCPTWCCHNRPRWTWAAMACTARSVST